MADKPLVLTKQNVCAVLERRKFQTRRIINPQPPGTPSRIEGYEWKPKFQVGDRAYVKEGYQITGFHVCQKPYRTVSGIYLADKKPFSKILTEQEHKKWLAREFPLRKTPGRFMYKSLARIFLPIAEVRVERLQDISEDWEECLREGIDAPDICEAHGVHYKALLMFIDLWNSIHGEGAWERNDMVFVYSWDEIIIKGE